MSRAISPTSGRPCSLAAVCRAWRPARATVYQRRPPTREAPRRRPGPPVGALVEAMRGVLAVSFVSGEGHREVWAGLRHGGVRTSMRRVLRLMGESDLLAPPRARSPRGPRSRDGTIIPEVVDSMFLRPRAGGFGPSAPIWAMSCSRSERRSV